MCTRVTALGSRLNSNTRSSRSSQVLERQGHAEGLIEVPDNNFLDALGIHVSLPQMESSGFACSSLGHSRSLPKSLQVVSHEICCQR